MKILLVGEFSGLHSNLKAGLESLGHHVVLLSDGDGWKKIQNGINLPNGTGLLGRVLAVYKKFNLIRSFRGYDVVQFIYPHIFNRLINRIFINILIKNNQKSYLVAAGSDALYWISPEKKFDYYPHKDVIEIDQAGRNSTSTEKWFVSDNLWLASKVNGIIPSAYDYKIGYVVYPNLKRTIPMPLDFSEIPKLRKKVYPDRAIRILHGKSRPGFKGSKYIIEAMKLVKNKYGDDVQLIFPDRLPYKEYLIQMADVDIVIDQALTYSYGVNAIVAMAMGKVVLSGAEPECLKELGVESCPVINIKPDIEFIFNKLDHLISAPEKILEISINSIKFVNDMHESRIVAKKYIDVWMA